MFGSFLLLPPSVARESQLRFEPNIWYTELCCDPAWSDVARPVRRRIGELCSAQCSPVTTTPQRGRLWEVVVPAKDAAAAVIAKKDKPTRACLLGPLSEDILLQVSSKKTAAELWASLKTRFVGADWVRATRLATLRGEFNRLRMEDGDELDTSPGGSAARDQRHGTWASERRSTTRQR